MKKYITKWGDDSDFSEEDSITDSGFSRQSEAA
jgi:hypothetical protein